MAFVRRLVIRIWFLDLRVQKPPWVAIEVSDPVSWWIRPNRMDWVGPPVGGGIWNIRGGRLSLRGVVGRWVRNFVTWRLSWFGARLGWSTTA